MRFSLRHALPLIVFALLVIILLMALYANIFGQRNARQLPSMLIGKLAPIVSMPALHAQGTINLGQYRGQMVAVNFFASWCLPCRIEAPALDYLSDFMPIVGIAYKDRPEDTLRFLRQYGDPFAAIATDAEGRFGLQWGSYGLPETYLVNSRGEIVWKHTGLIDRQIIDNQLLLLRESS